MNSALRLLVIVFPLVLISSCGWQLRGSQNLMNVSTVHISAKQPTADVPQALKQALRAYNIGTVPSATDASHAVVILNESSKRRTLTVGGNGKASEYLLTKKVQFLILDPDGKLLLTKKTVSTQRTYDNDENRPVAKSTEETLLYREMSRTLAEHIIRTLGNITP